MADACLERSWLARVALAAVVVMVAIARKARVTLIRCPVAGWTPGGGCGLAFLTLLGGADATAVVAIGACGTSETTVLEVARTADGALPPVITRRALAQEAAGDGGHADSAVPSAVVPAVLLGTLSCCNTDLCGHGCHGLDCSDAGKAIILKNIAVAQHCC